MFSEGQKKYTFHDIALKIVDGADEIDGVANADYWLKRVAGETAESTKAQFAKKLAKAENQIEKLTAKIAKLEAKNAALSDTNKALKELNVNFRMENADLKSSLKKANTRINSLTKENEKQAKTIENLKQKLNEKRKEHNKTKAALKRAEKKLEDKTLSDEDQKMIDAYQKEIQDAKEHIAILENSKNLDHESTSFPSSMTKFRGPVVVNSREKTDRKPGAQPGHTGNPRTIPANAEILEPCYMPLPKEVQDHPDDFEDAGKSVHYLLDLLVVLGLRPIISLKKRNKRTGKIVYTPFPASLNNEVNYGAELKTLAFTLNNYCNVSLNKISDLIRFLTDGGVKMAESTISGLTKTFAKETEQERKDIFDELLSSPYIGQDYSYLYENGKTVYVSSYTDDRSTLCMYEIMKGHEGLLDGPLIDYEGIVLGDHDPTLNAWAVRKQECLAHVSRYIKKSIIMEPDKKWPPILKSWLSETIAQFNEGEIDTPEKIHQVNEKLSMIVNMGLDEYGDKKPKFKDGYNLLNRLFKNPEDYLLFLDEPGLPHTNNSCERVARMLKRRLKQSGTFRSEAGTRSFLNCQTILQTTIKRGQDIFKKIQSVFERQVYGSLKFLAA